MNKIKCKDCPNYEQPTTHGHGEYYGVCRLMNGLKMYFSILLKISKWEIHDKQGPWADVKDPENTCRFLTTEEKNTK